MADADEVGIAQRLGRHEATSCSMGELPFSERLSALLGRDLTLKKPGGKPKRKAK